MNDKPHCMIDFETLGNKPDTAVLSLGVTLFSKAGIYASGEWFFNRRDQASRSISDETAAWWSKQPNGAFGAILKEVDEKGKDVSEVLDSFTAMLPPKFYIWSNGAGFDVPILEDLYESKSAKAPWAFWDIRCYRTLKTIFPDLEKGLVNERKHNALSDAKFQAEAVIKFLNAPR